MKKKILLVSVFCFVLFFFLAGAGVYAGEIDNWYSVGGEAGFIDGYIDNYGNDDSPNPTLDDIEEILSEESSSETDFNWLIGYKTFNTLNPIDFYINAYNSPGTTEYLFIEILENQTGQVWTDYHLELGILDGEDNFVKLSDTESGAELGLDFDTLDRSPTPFIGYVSSIDPLVPSPLFSPVTHTEDTLTFDGISVGEFSLDDQSDISNVPLLAFSLDIPYIEAVGEDKYYEFVLRQYPTSVVPEPASLLLFGFGLAGLGLFRKRKK